MIIKLPMIVLLLRKYCRYCIRLEYTLLILYCRAFQLNDMSWIKSSTVIFYGVPGMFSFFEHVLYFNH